MRYRVPLCIYTRAVFRENDSHDVAIPCDESFNNNNRSKNTFGRKKLLRKNNYNCHAVITIIFSLK